jgi:hypothetical protein
MSADRVLGGHSLFLCLASRPQTRTGGRCAIVTNYVCEWSSQYVWSLRSVSARSHTLNPASWERDELKRDAQALHIDSVIEPIKIGLNAGDHLGLAPKTRR